MCVCVYYEFMESIMLVKTPSAGVIDMSSSVIPRKKKIYDSRVMWSLRIYYHCDTNNFYLGNFYILLHVLIYIYIYG